MEPTQNTIHTSTFNFEYGSKASAIKGNALIESIFHSRILPELEQAISTKIPEGILIELSKLEINIGEIDEKDLYENLARRIRTSLEKALNFKLDGTNEIIKDDQILSNRESGKFILSSIEMFLTRGYFPNAQVKQHSFDDLILFAIQNYQNEFIEILKKNSNRKNVIRRTVSNLKIQTFDEIVFVLEPVNVSWIFEFRNSLIQLRMEMNLNHYTEAEFMQQLNCFILRFLLNNTASNFSFKRFATEILSYFPDVFQPFSKVLIQPTQNIAVKPAILILIEETLAELQDKETRISTKEDIRKMPLEKLVKMLNTGKLDFSLLEPEDLKKDIAHIIKNEGKRKLFVENLNEVGAKLMLHLFDKSAEKFFKLITGFVEKMGESIDKPATSNKDVIINKLVLQTVLYLSENAIRDGTNEEFLIFLIYASGLEVQETVNSSFFQGFVRTQENISLKKFSAVWRDEQRFHEISGIYKVLSNIQEQPQFHAGQKPKQTELNEYITIYKRKIIDYFFDSGHLPPGYENLSWNDVQLLFIELLELKDNFLAALFKSKKDSRNLIRRITMLTSSQTDDILNEYLIHFFQAEYSILSETIDEITQHFIDFTNRLKSKSLINEIFIRTLAESKGSSSAAVFSFFIFQNLKSELIKDNQDWNEFSMFLLHQLLHKFDLSTPPDNDEKAAHDSDLFYNLIHQNGLNLNISKSIQLKELLTLIINDEKLFERYISDSNKRQILSHINFENKEVQEENLFDGIADRLINLGDREVKEVAKEWLSSTNKTKTDQHKIAFSKTENEILKSLDYHVSVLKFYAKKGLFPWWWGRNSISELVTELKKISRLIPKTFEEMLLQVQKEDHVLELLSDAVSGSSLKEFDNLFASNATLKRAWELNIQNNKTKTDSYASQDSNSIRSIRTDKFNSEELINGGYKNDSILFKALYLFTDDEILSSWLVVNSEIELQIREYLALSPCFYYRNLNPPQWRQAVYRFSLEYYENSNKATDKFHVGFLNFLKKHHSNIRWTEILTTIYGVIKSSGKTINVTFPDGLIQLLNLEPVHQPTINDSDMLTNALTSQDEGIVTKIYNAGLILFWPFLTQLFEKLKLVKQGAFVNQEAKNRAVYLLQYLVFNATDFPEYELVLNKLLVGMGAEVHLESFVTITDEEKEMTKSLLKGLISNWEKVENSTPEGIQETFLQREAILRFKKEEVLLKVEKKGVDVLLNSIPWNLSVIKLSWMSLPIHVDWM